MYLKYTANTPIFIIKKFILVEHATNKYTVEYIVLFNIRHVNH